MHKTEGTVIEFEKQKNFNGATSAFPNVNIRIFSHHLTDFIDRDPYTFQVRLGLAIALT